MAASNLLQQSMDAVAVHDEYIMSAATKDQAQ